MRRLLLYVLTQNMHELAANIRQDPKLQEACAELAERSFEYFEWLDHDRELLLVGSGEAACGLRAIGATP